MSGWQEKKVSISRPLCEILKQGNIDPIELFDDCASAQRGKPNAYAMMRAHIHRLFDKTNIMVNWIEVRRFSLCWSAQSKMWDYEEVGQRDCKLRVDAIIPSTTLTSFVGRRVGDLIDGLPLFEKEKIIGARQDDYRLELRLAPPRRQFIHPKPFW